MTKAKVFITGVTGQMGSHAADLWLSRGHQVVGAVRPCAGRSVEHLTGAMLNDNFKVVSCDITDKFSLFSVLKEEQPDIVLHYAAQSQVGTSFSNPELTNVTNVSGSINMLEGMRHCVPEARGVFLATSEMFGNNYSFAIKDVRYQDESTDFQPVSPYGCSKLNMYWLVQNYRDSYNMPVCCAIQFNSEGPRRGHYFVTRKVTDYVASIYNWAKLSGINIESLVARGDKLYSPDNSSIFFPRLALGNLTSQRDWSHAKDSVRAHYLMAQSGAQSNYVISSGQIHSIESLVQLSFAYIGVYNYKHLYFSDPQYMRPNELYSLCGSSAKIRAELGWEPEYNFADLIREMVSNDLAKHRS